MNRTMSGLCIVPLIHGSVQADYSAVTMQVPRMPLCFYCSYLHAYTITNVQEKEMSRKYAGDNNAINSACDGSDIGAWRGIRPSIVVRWTHFLRLVVSCLLCFCCEPSQWDRKLHGGLSLHVTGRSRRAHSLTTYECFEISCPAIVTLISSPAKTCSFYSFREC